jgi:hypothetical protein
VSLAATPILLYGAPRYKVPAMPLITMVAAAGAVAIVDRLRRRITTGSALGRLRTG